MTYACIRQIKILAINFYGFTIHIYKVLLGLT